MKKGNEKEQIGVGTQMKGKELEGLNIRRKILGEKVGK